MSKAVYKISDVDLSNIIFDDEIYLNNKNLIVSKIFYRDVKMKTFFIQTSFSKIQKIMNCDNIIIIPDKKTEDFMENLDKLSMEFISSNDIVKKYCLKNFRYKTIINETETSNLNIIRIKLNENTNYFLNTTKESIDKNKCVDLIEGKKSEKIKVIFKIDGLIIDIKNKMIFTNIIASQISLEKITPEKIKLNDFSFVPSDDDVLEENSDIILNTQTEYILEKDKSDKELNEKIYDEPENTKNHSESSLSLSSDNFNSTKKIAIY